MRDANPVVYLIPGVGMITFARDKATARIAAEFYVNAINVMCEAEGVSSYRGIAGAGGVRHRVLGARGSEAAPSADPQAARWPSSADHRRGGRHRTRECAAADRGGRLRRACRYRSSCVGRSQGDAAEEARPRLRRGSLGRCDGRESRGIALLRCGR